MHDQNIKYPTLSRFTASLSNDRVTASEQNFFADYTPSVVPTTAASTHLHPQLHTTLNCVPQFGANTATVGKHDLPLSLPEPLDAVTDTVPLQLHLILGSTQVLSHF